MEDLPLSEILQVHKANDCLAWPIHVSEGATSQKQRTSRVVGAGTRDEDLAKGRCLIRSAPRHIYIEGVSF